MDSSFTCDLNPGRIVFGAGSVGSLDNELQRLGVERPLLLSTPQQRPDVERLAVSLGNRCAGLFTEAAMHTPVDVTERALHAFESTRADGVVSFGGGSTIGLGKAIAWRNDALQLVIATTYAGSEVTPILGQTEDGVKTTVRDPRILPEVVIYDPALTLGLPVAMSVTSGLNAMAHAVEALYAKDRNPIASLQALEGVRALYEALPRIVQRPDDLAARSRALIGSWLCGTVLGSVGMSLHHKLCHTLGGSFDLPHAETHAVMLPYSTAYNAGAAAEELNPLTAMFGADLGQGMREFALRLGAPSSLRELGLRESDLDRAADLAVRNPYWNPRPVEREAVRALLQHAWAGDRPTP